MFSSKSSTVIINGVSYSGADDSEHIVINGIQFKIDGANKVYVYVDGNAQKVQTSNGDIHVTGDVTNGVTNSNGDIECRDVFGHVSNTNGAVIVNGTVEGDVKTTNGDISHK